MLSCPRSSPVPSLVPEIPRIPPGGAPFARMKRGELKKGGMKFQSPSAQNQYEPLCSFLPPFSEPPLFVLANLFVLLLSRETRPIRTANLAARPSWPG